MVKKLAFTLAAALLLGACAESAPPPPVAQPPQMVQAPTFMVFFDWDRSNLSNQGVATVRQAAGAYKSSGTARLTATGHADRSGPDQYNMALSLRRANTVKDALVREGVPATAISVVGQGESMPLVQTADGVREPQNRRVEIAVGGPIPAIFSDPKGYCKALSDKWRQYRTSQVDTVEATAIAKCEAGDYAAGIPVLEDSLITARIALPAPGYRWPGRPVS